MGFLCKRLAVLLVLLLATTLATSQTIVVPLAPERWILSQKNFKLTQENDTSRNGEIVVYQGRKSLLLQKGLIYAPDVNLENGTIDVDMAPGTNGRFLGVAFHIQSDDNYEVIFFRPGASGTDQAIQYTPGLLGANVWQIYTGPGYISVADIPREKWTHVRIVVAGQVASVFLNNATVPSLVVPDLKLGTVGGNIGFWGHMGDAYFSNLTYTPAASKSPITTKAKYLPGTISEWSLSDVFDAGEKDPAMYPDVTQMKWEKVNAESPGMVVINRYRRSPNILPPEKAVQMHGRVPGSKFVFARTIIQSDREQVRKMNFGYSDEVVVFLNGKAIYAGNNTIGFREPDVLGLMTDDSDAVYLSLKKGGNELMFAVTEYFGGWGFICQLE